MYPIWKSPLFWWYWPSSMYIKIIVWGFPSYFRICHSYGFIIITGKGLQIFTYTRHSLQLSREGSFVCHTYCDTGHLLIWSSLTICDIHTCWRTFDTRAVTIAAGIRTPNIPHASKALNAKYEKIIQYKCKRVLHQLVLYYV